MIGWIILGLCLLGFTWLLWTPLRVEIDSENGIFRAEWRHICAVQWLPEEGIDRLRIEAPFFRRTVQLSGLSKPKQRPKHEEEIKPALPSKKKQSFSAKMMWRLGRNLLRTFKIKRLQIWWDSDDFIWNAQVYPLASVVNTLGVGRVWINFTGRRELALLVENRPGRIIWAFLYTFITKRSMS